MADAVEEIIEEFQREGVPELSKRELRIPSDIDKAVTVIGLRRVGKTYLLYQTIKKMLERGANIKEIFYINFEDERIAGFSAKDFSKVIELFYKKNPNSKKGYLFFDEIQNVDGWEKFVRRIVEKKHFRVYVTGSSSKLLSKEIATSLRGRSLSFHLFPLSFREFLEMKNFELKDTLIEKDRGLLKRYIEEYIAFGGFPEIIDFDKGLKIRTLKEYLDLIVYKDIVERYGIEKIGAMKFLIRSIVKNFANEVSIRKLHNFLSSSRCPLSKSKTYEYFSYLEDVGFVHAIRKFGYGFREIEGSIPKIYISDVGFAALYGIEDFGRRMENVVAVELFRRKHYFNPVWEIHYWRNYKGNEVDFVVTDGARVKQLIQATYVSGREEIEKRETESLIEASKELECRDLLVITWDYEGEEELSWFGTERKIKFVPLWKWLLKGSQ